MDLSSKINLELRRSRYVSLAITVILFLSLALNVKLMHDRVRINEVLDQTIVTLNKTIDILKQINSAETSHVEEKSVARLVEGPVEIDVVEEPVKYFDVPLDTDLQDYIFEVCEEKNVDPSVVIAMIKQESNYTTDAVGDGGNSLGLMQIQPRWHSSRMDKLGCDNLLDPYQNVAVGVDLIAELQEKDKPIEWVLMSYNGGSEYANRKFNNGEISTYASEVVMNSKVLEEERAVINEVG